MVDARLVSDRAPRMPEHRGPLSLLGRVWELLKDFWSVLRPMRFCVLVWIAISSLIIIVPQSQDALLALLEDTVAATRAGLADAARSEERRVGKESRELAGRYQGNEK